MTLHPHAAAGDRIAWIRIASSCLPGDIDPTEAPDRALRAARPLFNECLEPRDSRMLVPTRPGIGVSLSGQARAWTRAQAELGTRP
jgi:L-alanine-DL-glutamate epimerase-like enolase superfamily enzyme